VTQDTKWSRQVRISGTGDRLERIDIDAAHFAGRPTPPQQRAGQGGKPDIVVVPDTPYDPALWLGADDEGVGDVRGH